MRDIYLKNKFVSRNMFEYENKFYEWLSTSDEPSICSKGKWNYLLHLKHELLLVTENKHTILFGQMQ